MRLRTCIRLLVAIVALAVFLISCSGGSKPGTVNTSISDPPTCAAPQGPYRHVYVTVSDVLIHQDRKSTRLNSSHGYISYAVFCLKKKKPPQYANEQSHSLLLRGELESVT